MSQFDVYNTQVKNIMGWIHSDEIAIPEIQRPFVWKGTKVRDLVDSLYKGYPVGYLIIWKNPDVVLKDGTLSKGKKILIDGQQRITAIEAALAGHPIIDKNYQKRRIKIAFHPMEEKFEVSNAAIVKNSEWISDISEIFSENYSEWSFISEYCKKNDLVGEEDKVAKRMSKLDAIKNINLGVIELSDSLSIEEVTEIFIRINSQGVVLSSADFAMSKISSDSMFGGPIIRKMIEYFCHFWQRPMDYEAIISNDKEFSVMDESRKIKWAIYDKQDIYLPSYSDVLRVAFTYKFKRGKISDLVSLLSGRDFETRENKQAIAEQSFKKLKEGVEDYVNETNFKRFIMILHSAGVVDKSLVRSQNALNFAYALYLSLRADKVEPHIIEKVVRKWLVLCILTSRYSGSPESRFEYDIRRFDKYDPEVYLQRIEEGELSEAFWKNVLQSNLMYSVRSNPSFNVYIMAQIKNGARGFLSKQIEVKSLVEERGDIHHVFPKNYLKRYGITNKNDYNQVANYVYTQSEINVRIGDKAPHNYMQQILDQMHDDKQIYGGIDDIDDLRANLRENAIPEEIVDMDINDYHRFLELRRDKMSEYIREYYFSL
ncbi:MAG: DUF262 domain-containing protein [Peptoniphilus sp.]|nr:DUF262 domain-containing protein [Peptoniphilus sp.]MDD7362726.1 DUF262 domain-containing protein [Bacillota bacterium]MDY6044580.1 DUF262 domain-containing protein [Peptoniphilus sp.]